MKRFIQIVIRAVIIASIVILIGSCIYQYTDYKQHPEIYMLNSAPWYTGLLIQGVPHEIDEEVAGIVGDGGDVLEHFHEARFQEPVERLLLNGDEARHFERLVDLGEAHADILSDLLRFDHRAINLLANV